MEPTPSVPTGMRHYTPLQAAKGERERPFHCPVPNCNGRFQRKFTLREHMKTHTGEKPYQCAIRTCGKRFSTSGNLARHRRLHMLKKLECPVDGCTRIFTKSEKLARHLQNHLGSVAHICVVEGCGKTFSTAGNLTRHLRTQHPPGAKKMTAAALPDASAVMTGCSPGAASFGGPPPSMSSEDQFAPWVLNGTEMPAERASVSDLEMVELLQCLFTEENAHLRLQQHNELHYLRHVPQLTLPQLSIPQLTLPPLTAPHQHTPQQHHQLQHQHQQGQSQQSLSFLLSL